MGAPRTTAQAMESEIAAEWELFLDLSERALHGGASRMAKLTEMDRHYKERRRGRRPAGRDHEDDAGVESSR